MVPCRTQGVARDVRPPRRRDRLHRRTRSTLDTKRRGAVTRETHRCDQALRNRTTLFFRSTDPSNHIDPSEHISSTGESIQRESAFVHSNHKLLVDVRAIPARHRGICHCVPHNEGDNLGEHGRRGRLWQVTVHTSQPWCAVMPPVTRTPSTPSPCRSPLERLGRDTTDSPPTLRRLSIPPVSERARLLPR